MTTPTEVLEAGAVIRPAEAIIGRLADAPWREGDDLPEVGSDVLVSGVHADVESDQHRAFLWRTVVGYGEGDKFICLQARGCWPTVERTVNCWFAEIPFIRQASRRGGEA